MIRRSLARHFTSASSAALLACLVQMSFAPPARAQHAPEPELEASLPAPRTLTAEQWQSDVRFLTEASGR